MTYNLLYIVDDTDSSELFIDKVQLNFNVIISKDIQNALDVINSMTINCVVAELSKGIDVIGFLETLKLKAPSISRVLIVNDDSLSDEYNNEIIDRTDIMFVLNEPYESQYLKQVFKTACLANGNDKKALSYSINESVANKLENISLKDQFKAQEGVLRQYVHELFEAKEQKIKDERNALRAKKVRFKAVRLSWKATIIARAVLFAIVSGFVGAYKSELTKSFIQLITYFDD